MGGILTDDEQKKIISELLEKQLKDGGWNTASLGTYVRGDETAQEKSSDGCATGLILHVLQTAGIAKNDPKIAKGLNWLRANQEKNGEWRASSLNQKRDFGTRAGKYMSNAATAFAVLALSH